MKPQNQKYTRIDQLVTFDDSKPVYRNHNGKSFSLTQGPYHKYLVQSYECASSLENRGQILDKAQPQIGEPLRWILTDKTVPYFEVNL